MNKEMIANTWKKVINAFGENDGIVKRIYLSDICRIDGEYGQEDCLSVAIDIEENSLITFWQDENDSYTEVEYFSSLKEEMQNEIFNQVMGDYCTHYSICCG